jgi:ribonuclease HI
LDELKNNVIVNWQFVKGHSGDVGNLAADRLANDAATSGMVDPKTTTTSENTGD